MNKIRIFGGSLHYGKTYFQKKEVEYLRKKGKKVFVIGEKEDDEK